jgi:hypothetical protein
MKNTKISLCLLTAPLLLSGCLNSPKPGSPESMALLQKERQDEQSQIQQNIISETPDWFSSPRQSDVALYAAGTAKQATLKQASFAAESDARNRLIRALDSYIEGTFDEFFDENTAEALGVDSKIRSTTQTLVERRLRGSRISNSQYMATADGKVQGWVEIEFPLGSANQLIYDTIQQDQAMSQEARRSEAFKELEAKLARRKQQ